MVMVSLSLPQGPATLMTIVLVPATNVSPELIAFPVEVALTFAPLSVTEFVVLAPF